MSPELISPERFGFKNSRPTKASDCYALGMVIYETISGNLPFHKHIDLAVAMKVLEGEHPPRGMRFTKGLWEMLEQCWAPQPSDRPTVEDVHQRLDTFSTLPMPPSSVVDAGVEDDGDDSASDNNSHGVPNGTVGPTVTERNVTVSGMSYLTGHPPGEGINRLGREATDPDPRITRAQIDSNDGGTYQVRHDLLSRASDSSYNTLHRTCPRFLK